MKNKNECFILQRKMRRLIFILLFSFPLGLYAAGSIKWKKTAAGIYYKIYTLDTLKPKPVYGDHIWMHLKKYSPAKKEVFNTKIFDTGKGVEMEFKKSSKETDVTELFCLMGKGDSAVLKVPANLIDSVGHPKKYYTFYLHLADFKTKEEYEQEKRDNHAVQVILDSISIANYLNNHNLLDAQPDAYGNYFLIIQKGNGPKINDEDSVSIHYIGKLTNGKEFDNSYLRNQTLLFIVGKNQVIEGLDNGIRNFHFGDKGVLIIPSRLAYGDKEVGKIPANSVLIFELEIISE